MIGCKLAMGLQYDQVWYVKKALKSEDMVLPQNGVHQCCKQEVLCNWGYNDLPTWDATVVRPSRREAAEVALASVDIFHILQAMSGLLVPTELGQEPAPSYAGVHKRAKCSTTH